MTRFALTCAALLAVQPAFAQSVQPETPEVIVNPNFDKLVSIVKGQPMTAKRVLKPNKGVSK